MREVLEQCVTHCFMRFVWGFLFPDTIWVSYQAPHQMQEKRLDTRCQLPCIFGLSNSTEKEWCVAFTVAWFFPVWLPCYWLEAANRILTWQWSFPSRLCAAPVLLRLNFNFPKTFALV